MTAPTLPADRDAEPFGAVWACAVALLHGRVLHAGDVTVGREKLIDWRMVRSGEEIQCDSDAAALAQLFVALVGPEAALTALDRGATASPSAASVPEVIAYAVVENGGRRRSFAVRQFRIYIEPVDNDEGAEEFARALAEAAASLEVAL